MVAGIAAAAAVNYRGGHSRRMSDADCAGERRPKDAGRVAVVAAVEAGTAAVVDNHHYDRPGIVDPAPPWRPASGMELDGSAIDSLSCWAIVIVRWPCRPDRHELGGKDYLLFKRPVEIDPKK
jgi:hypothetical protein